MKFSRLLITLVILMVARSASAQSILVEVFTNTSCVNCIQPDNDFDIYLKTHANIEPVFFHTNFPSPTDAFYKASKSTADYTINTFYNVGADPQAFVNGSDAGIKFPDWKSAIDGASTSYSATVNVSAVPSTHGADIQVDLGGTSGGKSVRLFVALTESNINYDNKGTFGNPEGKPVWNNVFRRMLSKSDGSGTDAFILSGAKHYSMSLDTTGTGWNVKNMRVIAFVQEDNPQADAPIHGIVGYALSTAGVASNPINASGLGAPIPNPFSSSTSLPIELKNTARVTVTIVNELGADRTLINDRMMSAGAASLPLDLHGYPVGMYQARVFVNGVFAGSQKLVRISE